MSQSRVESANILVCSSSVVLQDTITQSWIGYEFMRNCEFEDQGVGAACACVRCGGRMLNACTTRKASSLLCHSSAILCLSKKHSSLDPQSTSTNWFYRRSGLCTEKARSTNRADVVSDRCARQEGVLSPLPSRFTKSLQCFTVQAISKPCIRLSAT